MQSRSHAGEDDAGLGVRKETRLSPAPNVHLLPRELGTI